MDGLLVDSEILWHAAEVEILCALGVPIDSEAGRNTKGMFVGEVTQHIFDHHPWIGPTPAEVAITIVDRVIELVLEKGVLLPGAREAVETCQESRLALALASSSQYRLIRVVLEQFELGPLFSIIHSAEDESYGKPHPGVFLSAASKLGIDPSRCLVFEDAPAGVLAAKAARMSCVAVPEKSERERPEFALADFVLGSLEEFDSSILNRSQPDPF